MMTRMSTTLTSIVLPEALIREIDEAVAESGRTREEFLQAAVRRFAGDERRWREVQDDVSRRAQEAGIFTEDDVEDFIDSISE
jgi:metal-responsive CopG/Arc/MetJ family transcriptional regulator